MTRKAWIVLIVLLALAIIAAITIKNRSKKTSGSTAKTNKAKAESLAMKVYDLEQSGSEEDKAHAENLKSSIRLLGYTYAGYGKVISFNSDEQNTIVASQLKETNNISKKADISKEDFVIVDLEQFENIESAMI